jgi:SAM-dependent methyltransferase
VSRHGARQDRPFNPSRAARLDDPARFVYLPIDEVIALVDAPRDATVVDYGTGTGAYALPLALRRPDLHVVALDVQPEMLALLRAKPEFAALRNLETVTGPPPELRHAVARVFGINVLHELGDDALAAIAALLAPGGRFVTIDWNAGVERPAGPPAERVYRPQEARERLESLGWHIVEERLFPYQYALVVERPAHRA